MDKEEQGHWDHVLMVAKLTVEIDRLQKQAHYHYENGLKKDVEIKWLRDALTWIERHPVEESKQWEVAVKEMKRLARSALPQKETE